MPQLEVGFISSIANFVENLPLPEALKRMEPFEKEIDGDRELTQALVLSFTAFCDAALKSVLAEAAPSMVTLRVDDGYAWVEGRKHWLRLGASLFADQEELIPALDVLDDPVFAGTLDFRLDQATRTFVNQHLPSGLFGEMSSAFAVFDNLLDP